MNDLLQQIKDQAKYGLQNHNLEFNMTNNDIKVAMESKNYFLKSIISLIEDYKND